MNTRTSATRISAKGATKTRARRSQSQTVQLPAGLGEASSALPEKPRVQSAARTIGILLAIARSREGLQVKEISTALKLPRQVTYHLLHTLSATGVIRKRHENRYVLGLAAAIIAEGFRRQLGPPEQLAQKVREVAAKCGETAYASGWVDGEIVVLASARGHSAVHAAEVSQGHSEDAHARASGKLLLALADPMTCEAYLSRHRLSARTRNTMTSIRKLTAAFEEIRNNGYSVDKEEFAEGLCCLAVPLEVAGGQIVLSISVPADRFEGNLNRYLTALRAQARLGYDE
jgi:DNA-binding IclR family transcriptional regulator